MFKILWLSEVPPIVKTEPLKILFVLSIVAVEPFNNSNSPAEILYLLNILELFNEVLPLVCV